MLGKPANGVIHVLIPVYYRLAVHTLPRTVIRIRFIAEAGFAFLATIRAPEIARKILDHLGIPSRPPPVAPAIFQELPFTSNNRRQLKLRIRVSLSVPFPVFQ